MKTGIYKITNHKGRIYIGQSKNIDERIARHKKLQCCKHQLFLYRSFLKYGVDNHSFEIILRGDFTKKELNSFESKFVKEYNSFNGWKKGGLNLTTGGDSYEFDESVKQKMSNTRKRKISEGQLNSKLTVENVKEIKLLIIQKVKQRDIAKKFNVKPTTISEIKAGRSWKNINI